MHALDHCLTLTPASRPSCRTLSALNKATILYVPPRVLQKEDRFLAENGRWREVVPGEGPFPNSPKYVQVRDPLLIRPEVVWGPVTGLQRSLEVSEHLDCTEEDLGFCTKGNPFRLLPREVLVRIGSMTIEVLLCDPPFKRPLIEYRRWRRRGGHTRFDAEPFFIMYLPLDITMPPKLADGTLTFWPVNGQRPLAQSNPAAPTDVDFPFVLEEELRRSGGHICPDNTSPLLAEPLLHLHHVQCLMSMFIGAHVQARYVQTFPCTFPQDSWQESAANGVPTTSVQCRTYMDGGREVVQPLTMERLLTLEYGRADWAPQRCTFFRIFGLVPPSFDDVGQRFPDLLDELRRAVDAVEAEFRWVKRYEEARIMSELDCPILD